MLLVKVSQDTAFQAVAFRNKQQPKNIYMAFQLEEDSQVILEDTEGAFVTGVIGSKDEWVVLRNNKVEVYTASEIEVIDNPFFKVDDLQKPKKDTFLLLVRKVWQWLHNLKSK